MFVLRSRAFSVPLSKLIARCSPKVLRRSRGSRKAAVDIFFGRLKWSVNRQIKKYLKFYWKLSLEFSVIFFKSIRSGESSKNLVISSDLMKFCSLISLWKSSYHFKIHLRKSLEVLSVGSCFCELKHQFYQVVTHLLDILYRLFRDFLFSILAKFLEFSRILSASSEKIISHLLLR